MRFLRFLLAAVLASSVLTSCTDLPMDPTDAGDPALAAPALDKLGVPATNLEALGPYAVGYRVEDTWLPGSRPLRLHYWYPASSGKGAKAIYKVRLHGVPIVPGVADPIAFQVESDVAVNGAPVSGGVFPAVVMSPGYGNMGFDQAGYGEHLASHGFVVVELDHSGSTWDDWWIDGINGALGTSIPCMDNQPAPCLDGDFASLYIGRIRDVVFTLDVLEGIGGGGVASFLQGHVDPDALGMMGHSSGAVTAVVIAAGFWPFGIAADARVRSIMPLGLPGGMPDFVFQATEVPVLFSVGTDDGTTPPFVTKAAFDAVSSSPRLMVELEGAEHRSYNTEWCNLLQNLGATVLESERALVEYYFLSNVLTHPSSGTAFDYCTYRDFTYPMDLTALVEQITGTEVTPASVPRGMALDETTRITASQATSFFKWTLAGEAQYERFLLPNNVRPPARLTRCFDNAAGTFCWEGGTSGYVKR